MNTLHLLLPPLLLVGLTLVVMVMLALKKRTVAKQGLLPRGFFKLNSGAEIPAEMAQLSNNYDNLLALPMLFYALVGLVYSADLFQPAYVVLAWVYVACRYLHSYVHITSNRVKWRYRTFMWSFVTLSCMWLLMLTQVLTAMVT